MKLGSAVSRAADFYRDRRALVCAGKERTFSEININSNRVANWLVGLGLKKGDKVALVSDNCVEYMETDFAIYKSGLVRVAVNPMLSSQEVVHIVKDSEASVVFVSDRLVGMIEAVRDQLTEVKHVICLSGNHGNLTPFSELLSNIPEFECPWEIEEDDLSMLFYTGGTTGVPKGAMHTHESVSQVILNLQSEFWLFTQSDVFLSGGSMAHANGFRGLVCFLQGGVFIIPDHFDPKDILETVEREKVTLLSTVPTTLIRICNYEGFAQHDLSSLRMITYGAAPMPTDRLRDAIKIFGPKMAQSYGQAEALMAISVLSPFEHKMEGTEKEMARLSSAGRPYMSNDVKIVDDQGKEVARGEIGEIIARSKILMKGYWKKPEATAEALKDGWIHTGDLGKMDEDGYLFLIDRKKDMIISGGYNIYAREVEEVIHEHPSVSETAVIGIPDEKWGESVKAFVILKPGKTATEEEIVQFTKERLASFKKPKSVEFVSDLPRTAASKISKKDLKAPYWEGKERSIN